MISELVFGCLLGSAAWGIYSPIIGFRQFVLLGLKLWYRSFMVALLNYLIDVVA